MRLFPYLLLITIVATVFLTFWYLRYQVITPEAGETGILVYDRLNQSVHFCDAKLGKKHEGYGDARNIHLLCNSKYSSSVTRN